MALDFDGVDDRVVLTDIDTDSAANLTVMFWLYYDAAENLNGFVCKTGSAGFGWSMHTSTTGGGTDDMHIHMGQASGEGNTAYTTDNSLTTGAWAHWAGVFDGGATGDANRLRLYKDAAQKTLSFAAAVGTALPTGGDAENLCYAQDNDAFQFNYADCKLAHVKIWKASLTAAEVSQEFRAYRPRRRTNLLVWTPLDDGTSARDYSGGGNHGTVTGARIVGGPPQIPHPERFIAQKHRHGGLGLWGHRVLVK